MVVSLEKPLLSIVIPAHNEEHRLPQTLEKIADFLAVQPYEAEVLIVENGSHDDTLVIAQRYAEMYPNIHALHISARGKGLAVREGMLKSTGEYRFICDADLSCPLRKLINFCLRCFPALM